MENLERKTRIKGIIKGSVKLGIYAGIMTAGYYLGEEYMNSGRIGLLISGFFCIYNQDVRNMKFSDKNLDKS